MEQNLTFGQALEAVKQGKLISREGWNGKGMFIFMRPEDELPITFVREGIKFIPQSVKDYFKTYGEGETHYASGDEIKVKFTAYLCIKAADNSIINGWRPTQPDMLSNDWIVLD